MRGAGEGERVRVRARVRVRVAAGLTEPTWLSPWLLSARTVHIMCLGRVVRCKLPPSSVPLQVAVTAENF